MKKIILILILNLITFLLFSQNASNKDMSLKFFKFFFGVKLPSCEVNGFVSNFDSVAINSEAVFKIVGVPNDQYFVIKILKYYNDSDLNKKYENKLFLLSKTDFNKNVIEVEPKHSLTFGSVTLPFKFRFGSNDKDSTGRQIRFFDMATDINVGITAGYKYRRNFNPNTAHNFLVGFNLIGIKVDSTTTRGFQKSNTTIAGFSPMIGYLLETNQFQFGFFTGCDYLPGEIGTKWIYADQWWFGIGIGYSIFSRDVNKTSSQE